jgi:membrane-associated phospholipid phosphatase
MLALRANWQSGQIGKIEKIDKPMTDRLACKDASPLPGCQPHDTRVSWYFTAIGLCVAGLLSLWVDNSVAKWIADNRVPHFLQSILDMCEPFGDGLGVVLIILVIHQLDPSRRWAIPRVLTAAWLSGMAANITKLIIERTRPRAVDWSQDLAASIWSTFGQWLPLTKAGSAGQSFPSGHTATAVGLAIALAWLYPRGRWLFFALAACVGLHRVASSAHYISDVLFGAAIGCAVAALCVKTGALKRAFDRWEQRWRGTAGAG